MRSRSPEDPAKGVPHSPRKPVTVPDTPSHRGLDACPPIADPIEGFTCQEPKPFGKDNHSFRIGVSETALRSRGRIVPPTPQYGSPIREIAWPDQVTRGNRNGPRRGNGNASPNCRKGLRNGELGTEERGNGNSGTRGIGNDRSGKGEREITLIL
jgi:hypothetical protein